VGQSFRRLVLLDGRVGIDTFTDAKVRQPAIVDLLDRITLQMDSAIPARFDQMHVAASVDLADGRRVRARLRWTITARDHLMRWPARSMGWTTPA
jgi:2-methylcitrate dehydratase PrpD